MADSDSTQSHLKIASIEEGVLILRDGSLAVVLRVYPINFDLKNELEQNAIVAKFQGFLNSLEFPLQIVVRSKRLDLAPYLNALENRTRQLTSDLLQIQANDYIGFMKSLAEVANIMSKEYYVVLLYHRAGAKEATGGLLSVFTRSTPTPHIPRSEFDRLRSELNGRANTVAGGLTQLGLRLEALDTQQLIELFYNLYNPDISSSERLVELANIQTEVVTRAEEPATTAEPPVASNAEPADRLEIHPDSVDIGQLVGAAPIPPEATARAAVEPTAAGPTPAAEPTPDPTVSPTTQTDNHAV